MKTVVLGNFVKFKSWDYASLKNIDRTIKVDIIYYNICGILIFSSNDQAFTVDERKPIFIKRRKIVFNVNDPYGEEDWDED